MGYSGFDVPIITNLDYKKAKVKLINRKKEMSKGMNMEILIKNFK